MVHFFILNISTTVVIILATLIFARVCVKKREFISWLFAYISASISEVLRLFSQENYDTIELISITFSALSVLIFIIAVSKEYIHTFSNKGKTVATYMILFATIQDIISFSLQILVALFLFIALFLSIRIYIRKKKPTHAFMSFILITGFIQLIASIVRDQGIAGADEFFEFSRVVMVTIMLITGVVAIIEERILSSENKYRLAYNRAEFYKDLFVHDINNILQNLQFSLEIMSQTIEGYEKKEKLDELIKISKNQVKRGAELGLNVKKLSDLEIGVIKSEPINVNKILEKVINNTKAKYSEEEIRIDYSIYKQKIYVVANLLLADIFRIILNNAIRYNDNSTKEISIEISKEDTNFGSNIRVEIKDNGIGIPDPMKKVILQPFYKKTKDYKRIGLGLLLVNAVVKSFSGKIWVEDKILGDYSKGSNVIILIPEACGFLDIER